MDIIALIAQEFDVNPQVAQRIVALIDEGNTIPFIARYRKEQTGAMDDQKLRELSERLEYLRNLDKRREQIQSAIKEQGMLTDELTALLDGLHFHTLCEQDADALEKTLQAVEEKFGDVLPKMKWLNMGGGHHITREAYHISLGISGGGNKQIAVTKSVRGITQLLQNGAKSGINMDIGVCCGKHGRYLFSICF